MRDDLVMRLREAPSDWPDADLHYEAADAICELLFRVGQAEALIDYYQNTSRWIPVTERLPEMNTSCLLYNKYYGPMVGARIDEMRFRIPGSRFPDTPTHWMPLPEPPKEET